ncbi:BACON domain-containing carbohydrate-binding protein [Desulfococcaceae bacterium HSG8]|nr:BACON domain-containing carbohydrate-binding protein [Desulfococcaceae bacterium HSG8]
MKEIRFNLQKTRNLIHALRLSILIIILGAVFFVSNVQAAENYALSFDGTDDYVNCGDAPFQIPTGTWEAWFRADDIGSYRPIISKYKWSGYNDDGWLGLDDGKLYFSIEGYSTSDIYEIYSDSTISAGIWYHVAAVWGVGGMKMYVNGVLQSDTDAYASGIVSSGTGLHIGQSDGFFYYYFQGRIDEVRIWNTARTQAEIQKNRSRTLKGDEAGLVAYYRFDHLPGTTTLADMTSAGNNGTLVAMDTAAWVESGAPVKLSYLAVEGEVKLPDGNMVGKAPVSASCSGGSIQKTTSDGNGKFVFEDLNECNWTIKAEPPATGYDDYRSAQIAYNLQGDFYGITYDPPVLILNYVVNGSVKLPDGNAVSSPKVSACCENSGECKEVTGDGTGSFEFDDLYACDWEITASPPAGNDYEDYRPAEISYTYPQDQGNTPTVVLNYVVRGEVKLADGGAASAPVSACCTQGASEVCRETTADSAGNFVFEDLYACNWRIEASPPSGAQYSDYRAVEVSYNYSLTEAEQSGAPVIRLIFTGLRGKITLPGGEAVSGASVSAIYDCPWWDTECSENTVTSVTDENGKFLLSGMSEGNWIIGASPPAGNKYAEYDASSGDYHHSGDEDLSDFLFELELTPRINVTGSVGLSDGSIPEYARVFISRNGRVIPLGEFGENEILPDEDGVFRCKLDKGTYEIEIMTEHGDLEHPDISYVKNSFSIADVDTLIPLDFTMPQSSKKINGTVKFKKAREPDVYVDIFNAENPNIRAYVKSDEYGDFSANVSGGIWMLEPETNAFSGSWDAFSPGPQTVQFAEDTSEEVITTEITLIAPEVYLTGRILTPEGDPLTPARDFWDYEDSPPIIEIRNLDRGVWQGSNIDQNGYFFIPMLSGLCKVILYLNDYPDYAAPILDPFDVTPENEYVGDIRLVPRSSGMLRGTVTNAQGEGVFGIQIDAWQPGTSNWFSSLTDSDGDYSVSLSSGTWVVEPHIPPGSDAEEFYLFTGVSKEIMLTEDEEDTADFELEDVAGIITGIVEDEVNDKLMHLNAWAYAHRRGNPRPVSEAQIVNGEFQLRVPENLMFVGLHPVPQSGYFFDTDNEKVELILKKSGEFDKKNITIIMETNSAFIRGTLKGVNGETLTGIPGYVSATSAGNTKSWQKGDIDPDDGSFTISVTSGEWNLMYYLDTEKYSASPPEPILVEADIGQTVTQDITLIPLNAAVNGQVETPDGSPAPGTQVWIRSFQGKKLIFENQAPSDSDGRFRFSVPLDKTQGRVVVGTAVKLENARSGRKAPRDYDNTKDSGSQEPGFDKKRDTSSSEVLLKLRRADTWLEGKVIDESGQPVEDAYISAYSPDGQRTDGYTDSEGLYRLHVAREENEDANIWTVSAAHKSPGDYTYSRSVRTRHNISGTDAIVTIPVLLLKNMGQLLPTELHEFEAEKGWDRSLSDGVRIQIPADAVPTLPTKPSKLSPSAEDESGDKINVVIETRVNLPETAENRNISYGYYIAGYDKKGVELSSPFNTNAVVTFCYTDEQLEKLDIEESDIRPAFLLEESNSWMPVKSYTIDREADKVTFEMDHFGLWSLVAKDEQPILSVTPLSVEIPESGGTTTFQVENSGTGIMNWTAHTDETWLTVKSGASGTGDGTITVKYEENFGAVRTGIINVVADSDTLNSPRRIEITQKSAFQEPLLWVTPFSAYIPETKGSVTFTISNLGKGALEWEAVTNDDWLAIQRESSSSSGGIITVSYDTNTDIVRTGIITVTAANALNSPQTVEIAQASGLQEPYLFVSPLYDEVLETAGTITFEVKNAGTEVIEWTAVSNVSWLNLESGSSGTNDGTITVRYDANSGIGRTGTVTVTAAGEVQNSPQVVEVRQTGGLQQTFLSVTPLDIEVPRTSGTTIFNIANSGTGTMQWHVTSKDDWLTIDSETSGISSGTVTVSYEANVSIERTGTVEVTADDAGNSPQIVKIRQSRGLQQPYLLVGPLDIEVSENSGTVTFDIENAGTGITEWTAVSNTSWLTLEGETSGVNDGTVTARCSSNESIGRIGTITVTGTYAMNSPQTVRILQANGLEEPFLLVTPLTVRVSGAGGESVSADIVNLGKGEMDWVASSDTPWLEIKTIYGTGDGTITVTSEANPGDTARIGSLTVVSVGTLNSPQTIQVRQMINGPDVDDSETIDMRDVILSLQACIQASSPSAVYPKADINGDEKIGLHEAIRALRKLFSQ